MRFLSLVVFNLAENSDHAPVDRFDQGSWVILQRLFRFFIASVVKSKAIREAT